MKVVEPVDKGLHEMFRSNLDQTNQVGQDKVVLANKFGGQFLSGKYGEDYTDKLDYLFKLHKPVDRPQWMIGRDMVINQELVIQRRLCFRSTDYLENRSPKTRGN